MKFREWKIWVRSKPLCLRWFIYLVLFRTIIDSFYSLKEISPLLSPLYIVGILTPVFIFMSYTSLRFPKKEKTKIDKIMFAWGILVAINLPMILLSDSSLSTIGNLIKYFTTILLFFYLRHFIREKKDLIGIFQTFLYSFIFALILAPYNYYLNPKAFRQLSIGRGGEFRFAGGYADIMTYGIIIIGVLMIIFYLYIHKRTPFKYWRNFKIFFFITLFICWIGLTMIKHTSSWGVAFILTVLFILYLIKRTKIVIPSLILLISFGIYFQGFSSSKIDPLIEKEISVLSGKAKIDRAFNGRMWRWRRYFRVWGQMPLYAKVFGVSFSVVEEKIVLMDGNYKTGFSSVIPIMISAGMHNDYIRILFLSGVAGLYFYLFFLFQIFKKRKYLNIEDQFLALASFVIVVLYSITTLPTTYPSLLYIVFSVFAYVTIPQKVRSINEKKNINIR